ncbi:MAG: hypothetical protein ACI97N_002713, partial [Cognaticolwellia sp.]
AAKLFLRCGESLLLTENLLSIRNKILDKYENQKR